jgi:AcrR family transcriptional regulator
MPERPRSLNRRSIVTRVTLAREELRHQKQAREQIQERLHEIIHQGRGDASTEVVWTRLESATRRTRREVDRIVDAAIDVADRDGLEALSMRRLAQELDTGTTSIYRYVTSKDELLELMVDAVNAEDPFPGGVHGTWPTDDWRTGFTMMARAMRLQMLAHPWLAAEVPTRPAMGPNTLRIADTALGIAARMTPDQTYAGAALATLMRYVRGAVSDELSEIDAQKRTGMTELEWRQTITPYVRSVLDTGLYPSFAAAIIEGEDLTAEEQFEFGLARIIEGFEQYAASHSAATGTTDRH